MIGNVHAAPGTGQLKVFRPHVWVGARGEGHRVGERQAGRQTDRDRQAGRQTECDRQAGRQADRQRQTGWQTDRV